MLKFWEIFKKYWWISLVSAALAYSQFRVYDMQKVVDATIQSNDTQIETLNKTHNEEIKKRDDLIDAHEKELKELEESYQQKSEELAEEKVKKIKVIVKYYDNPDKLAAKIIDTWNFKYVK